MTIRKVVENLKKGEKLKVKIYYKDPSDENLDIFVSLGLHGIQAKQGVPVEVTKEILTFMLDKNMTGIPKYYTKDGKQMHKMVEKYLIQIAEEDDESIEDILNKEKTKIDDNDFKAY